MISVICVFEMGTINTTATTQVELKNISVTKLQILNLQSAILHVIKSGNITRMCVDSAAIWRE